MQPGRREGSKGSKTAIVKAFYNGKTFNEALELSRGLDKHTAALIWTACKRVEDFMYIGAADLHRETGVDKWLANVIYQRHTQKRRREKVESRKNGPKIYLTSKAYYRSV